MDLRFGPYVIWGTGHINLAAAVPVLNEAGELGILVVTRDLWSLRLESRFQTTGDVIDNLSAQLTERASLVWEKR